MGINNVPLEKTRPLSVIKVIHCPQGINPNIVHSFYTGFSVGISGVESTVYPLIHYPVIHGYLEFSINFFFLFKNTLQVLLLGSVV